MNRIAKYLVPLLGGVILLGVSNYASNSANPKDNKVGQIPLNPSLTTQPSPETPVASQSPNAASSEATTLKPLPASAPTAQNTVTVSIYRPDSQCQVLVPEQVTLSARSSAEAAVGKVLEQRNNADFNLAGYRIKVNPKSGVATVDMRLTPNSRRKFVSLSSCEQFALFGSLRKTLTSNQRFKIKDVRFTEQGQEIFL